MVTERTARHTTAVFAIVAFVVSVAVLASVLSLAAYALNSAGFTVRVTPEETYDGPPQK